jgi:hypothetical protein
MEYEFVSCLLQRLFSSSIIFKVLIKVLEFPPLTAFFSAWNQLWIERETEKEQTETEQIEKEQIKKEQTEKEQIEK